MKKNLTEKCFTQLSFGARDFWQEIVFVLSYINPEANSFTHFTFKHLKLIFVAIFAVY